MITDHKAHASLDPLRAVNRDCLQVVELAAMRVTQNPAHMLVTYALGSCIGLTLYDPAVGIGGMMHCLLPLSRSNPERAANSPCCFVDSGATELLRTMYAHGARRDRIVAKAAGGGAAVAEDRFRIGAKNNAALERILRKNRLELSGSCLGGNDPKTMYLRLHDGATFLRTPNGIVEL